MLSLDVIRCFVNADADGGQVPNSLNAETPCQVQNEKESDTTMTSTATTTINPTRKRRAECSLSNNGMEKICILMHVHDLATNYLGVHKHAIEENVFQM